MPTQHGKTMKYITRLPVTDFADELVAVFEFHREDLEKIKRRVQEANEQHDIDSSFYCLQYWDYGAGEVYEWRHFEGLEWFDEISDQLWEGVWVKMPPEWKMPEAEEQRIQYFIAKVDIDHIWWEVLPKHWERSIYTSPLPHKALLDGDSST